MKYLGVDFGLRRVGLAISEGVIASPLQIVEGKNLADLSNKISEFSKKGEFDKVIVGMPEGKTGEATQKFINALKRSGIDVESTDETLSTQNATHLMVQMGLPKKKRAKSDAQAAAEILQNYLDSLSSRI
jgi:putative holliday junction resolvase